MSTEKLVAAIVDGDAQQIQQSFNQVMADKALEYIDAARQVVAQNMFNVEEEVDYLDEARADSSEKEYRDWSAEDHERESRPGGMYASDRKWHLAQAKKKRKAKNAVKEEVDYLDEAKQTPIRYKEVRNKKGKLEFQVLNPEDLHHDLGTPDQYEEPVSSDMIDLISDHHPLKLEK